MFIFGAFVSGRGSFSLPKSGRLKSPPTHERKAVCTFILAKLDISKKGRTCNDDRGGGNVRNSFLSITYAKFLDKGIQGFIEGPKSNIR
jgi:hypothetical protein